jgi:hypothetical protein
MTPLGVIPAVGIGDDIGNNTKKAISYEFEPIGTVFVKPVTNHLAAGAICSAFLLFRNIHPKSFLRRIAHV